jgi:glycosyltransferase involved in cell wall biosynthesis
VHVSGGAELRILVVLPYGPSLTRVRSRMLLDELARRHQLTLVGLAWGEDDRRALEAWRERGVEVRVVPHGLSTWVRAAVGDPRRPLQQVVSTSPALARVVRDTLRGAANAGRPYDAVHVEHLRGAAAVDLLAGLDAWTVFDAVDCIAELARLTRRHNPNLLTRTVARVEEPRTRRLETALIASADVVTVVAERDRQALGAAGGLERIVVVPNGVDRLPHPVELTSEPVAIFTGKLSYHANQAAARRIVDAIWPAVRAAIPDARLAIAGAGAPRWLLVRHGRDGISVYDSPPDVLDLIARARLALAPMVYSVGIQNKILEAMACGVPVVATATATAGLVDEGAGALARADDDATFAGQVIRLLEDMPLAVAIGRAGYEYAGRYHSWAAAADRLDALYAREYAVEKAA